MHLTTFVDEQVLRIAMYLSFCLGHTSFPAGLLEISRGQTDIPKPGGASSSPEMYLPGGLFFKLEGEELEWWEEGCREVAFQLDRAVQAAPCDGVCLAPSGIPWSPFTSYPSPQLRTLPHLLPAAWKSLTAHHIPTCPVSTPVAIGRRRKGDTGPK
jgi:hypothetical protein